MTLEHIEHLIEKLSCDFILADPEEPESLSGLLPILKQAHGKCKELSLDDSSKEILKARKIIAAVLKNNTNDVDKEIEQLGEVISGLSSSIILLKSSDHSPAFAENHTTDAAAGDSNLDQIEQVLTDFSMLIGGFCPGEIPDLGALLNSFDELIEASKGKKFSIFHEISFACKGYVEKMTLENIHNTKPIEDGLILLRSILSHLKRGEVFGFDYSDVLELINIQIKEEQKPEQKEATVASESSKEPKEISPDDMEILIDFVSEAEENLDTIEVNLIDLEQDPTNSDIINDIFRPFHTIKGVSGFLSLTKINKLSHTTENLLDAARSGDFLINDRATDAILESVDTLKKLISRVQEGTQTGFMLPDDDMDVEALRDKLQKLQMALTKGRKTPLGEILVDKGEITNDTLDQALDLQKNNPDKKIGEILVDEKKVESKQVAVALMDQNQPPKKAAAQVKVSTEKLDDLVDYCRKELLLRILQESLSLPSPC